MCAQLCTFAHDRTHRTINQKISWSQIKYAVGIPTTANHGEDFLKYLPCLAYIFFCLFVYLSYYLLLLHRFSFFFVYLWVLIIYSSLFIFNSSLSVCPTFAFFIISFQHTSRAHFVSFSFVACAFEDNFQYKCHASAIKQSFNNGRGFFSWDFLEINFCTHTQINCSFYSWVFFFSQSKVSHEWAKNAHDTMVCIVHRTLKAIEFFYQV